MRICRRSRGAQPADQRSTGGRGSGSVPPRSLPVASFRDADDAAAQRGLRDDCRTRPRPCQLRTGRPRLWHWKPGRANSSAHSVKLHCVASRRLDMYSANVYVDPGRAQAPRRGVLVRIFGCPLTVEGQPRTLGGPSRPRHLTFRSRRYLCGWVSVSGRRVVGKLLRC
jgi:hypothetical protein